MTKEQTSKITEFTRNMVKQSNYPKDFQSHIIATCMVVVTEATKDLKKENAELKEFYEKEYFEIADRTADEKIKELEKYQTEEMFVPKELVRDLLKESYALSEHRNDQLTKAKEIIKDLLGSENTSCEEEMFFEIRQKAEQFLKDSEVEK